MGSCYHMVLSNFTAEPHFDSETETHTPENTQIHTYTSSTEIYLQKWEMSSGPSGPMFLYLHTRYWP